MMSITRSVLSVAYTSTDPLTPAGTMTALARTVPVGSFKDDTKGRDRPVGHAVRNPKDGPFGTAAKFSEYACALAGSPHELPTIGNVRVVCPSRLGAPNRGQWQ